MKLIGDIERIDRPSPALFKEASRGFTRPLLITGVVGEWSSQSMLSPETIKSIFGNVVVSVRESDDEFEHFFGAGRKKTMRLGDYVDLICSPEAAPERPPYLGNMPFDHPEASRYFARLKPLLKFPHYFPMQRFGELRLWLGGPGQRSTIHNDNYHNLNAQIYGTKSFLLLAPDQYPRLYSEELNETCWASRVNPEAPDLEKYPLFSDAEAVEVTLTKGDLLYIPIFWWHQAAARDVSISVSMFIHDERTLYWTQS